MLSGRGFQEDAAVELRHKDQRLNVVSVTFLRGSALLKVSFGDSKLVQLDPKLEDNETMSQYRISPDQQRLVFSARRGKSFWGAGREVTIVNYRDRFAKARTVKRHQMQFEEQLEEKDSELQALANRVAQLENLVDALVATQGEMK